MGIEFGHWERNGMSAGVLLPEFWGHGSVGMRAFGASSAHVSAEHSDDDQLMRRYRQGDADAFEVLYRRHRDRLHRYILRTLANAAEAEEVFQEVWIAVVRGSDRYAPRAKFTTYLFSIAHRRVLDRLRPRMRHSEESIDEEDLVYADRAEPAENASREEVGHALLDAIARLPVLQREAFLLQAEEGMSVDEIALVAGVNRETAKSRLRYANARLRRALEAWR